MIDTNRHAALLEVATRTGKELGWVQRQARDEAIPAFRDPRYGWLMTRDDAEALVKEWKPT